MTSYKFGGQHIFEGSCTSMNRFTMAKVEYEYTIREGATAIIIREDGAWAHVHDDENDIDDWETVLMEMIADDALTFRED